MTVKTGWLRNSNGENIAPKTFVSEVVDNDGSTTLTELLSAKTDRNLLSNVAFSGDYRDLSNLPFLDLSQRHFILIGDSYGAGDLNYVPSVDDSGNPILDDNGQQVYELYGWCKMFRDTYTLGSCYINPEGGAGFVQPSVLRRYTFQDLLEEIGHQITNKNQITDIVVVGGYNDGGHDYDDIVTNINLFVNYAKLTYPNATVRIGMVGWDNKHANLDAMMNNALNAYSRYYPYSTYLNGIEYCFHDGTYFHSDNIHPTLDGDRIIVRCLAECLVNGYTSVKQIGGTTLTSDVKDTANNTVGQFTNGTITTCISNNLTTINSSNLSVVFNEGYTRYCNADLLKIADIAGGHIVGNFSLVIPIRVMLSYFDNNVLKFKYLPENLVISERSIYITLEALNDDNTNYATITLNDLQIRNFVFSIDSMQQL